MNEVTRVSVPMTCEEREALKRMARIQLRHPRDQARYLLRAALGLTEVEVGLSPTANRGGEVVETHAAVAA